MTIIKRKDMDREFTKVVAAYMAKGMIFDTDAANGHQGEDGKVALTDGSDVYMIYLHRDFERVDFMRHLDVEKLTVEKHPIQIGSWTTYWLGKGEVVEETVWYKISDSYYSDVYVDSLEEMKRIHEMQMERLANNDHYCPNWKAVTISNMRSMNTIINVVKAKTGRKRVTSDNIVRVEKHTQSTNYWNIVTSFAGKQQSVYVHIA